MESAILEMRLILQGSMQAVSFFARMQQYIGGAKLDLAGECVEKSNAQINLLVQGELEQLKSLHRYLQQKDHGFNFEIIEFSMVPLAKDHVRLTSFELLMD